MNTEHSYEYIVETSVKDPMLVEKRREEITAAAVKIFSEKGYHATTTKEIADFAGMSVGTMFQYVKTKQDILYLVCCHIHSLIEEALYAVTTEDLNPLQMISKSVKALYEMTDHVSDSIVLMYQEMKSLDKQARKAFLNREQLLRDHLESQIEEGMENGVFGIDPKFASLLAEDILVQSHMWAFRRWSLSEQFTLKDYIDTRINLLTTVLIPNELLIPKGDF